VVDYVPAEYNVWFNVVKRSEVAAIDAKFSFGI
jgi:hypothetical protein